MNSRKQKTPLNIFLTNIHRLVLASGAWCLWVLSAPLYAQHEPQPVCGSPTANDPITLAALARSADTGGRVFDGHPVFTLGTIDTFWVFNFESGSFDVVPAELRAIGAGSLVWVSSSELSNGHVDTTVVSEILLALENRTPPQSRDSSKGILRLMREQFGDPPDVDAAFMKGNGGGKTHFLLCDIQDGWSEGGSYIAGFFYRIDVTSSGSNQFSNRRDLLYIDTHPGIFSGGSRSVEGALGTLSHEFQHLIHWNYDPDEITFFNEGLSEYSSYYCGYGLRSPSLYFEQTNVSLLGWNSELEDYSRAALWTLYLAEQYGDEFIGHFTRNGGAGAAGFAGAAVESGLSLSLGESVRAFHIANVLQDRNVSPAYGYRDVRAVSSLPRFFITSFGSRAMGQRTGLAPYAADYLRFFVPETLNTTILPTAGTVSATAIEFRDQQKGVSAMVTGSPYVREFPGSSYSEAIFVLQNGSSFSTASYTYSSAGVAKTGVPLGIAYDDGLTHSSPNQLFRQGDTAFVAFDGVSGGLVDSVMVWFASPGPMQLLVRGWNRSYDVNSQPGGGLGAEARMSAPASFVVTDTGYFGTTISLVGLNVRSSPDFLIELIYGAQGPNPLLRRDAEQSFLRSFLSLSQEPTPGRRMYSSFGDFYVRAYLSATNVDPAPPAQLPARFALHQNYPNPFNPATTISYDLPVRTRTRVAVFDVLGRVVAVLYDEEQDAGFHRILFDGARFSSGVYVVRLETPEYRAARKIVIVR